MIRTVCRRGIFGTPSNRRGAVLVAVLVCLLVVSLFGGLIVQNIFTAHQQARQQQDRQQALWLAESGLMRAAAQLHDNADYRSERWQIDAESLDGRRAAVVVISVTPLRNESGEFDLEAVAQLGNGPQRTTIARTARVSLSVEETP